MLRTLRYPGPGMLARFIDREFRRREIGIGEGSDRDGHDIGNVIQPVIHRRAAMRAEVERDAVPAVGYAHIFGPASFDGDLAAGPARLRAERAAGTLLAGEAMAHRHPHRLALACHAKLAAGTGGCPAHPPSNPMAS